MPRKGRNVRVTKTTRRSRRKGRKRSPTGDLVGLGYGAILGNVAVGAAGRIR